MALIAKRIFKVYVKSYTSVVVVVVVVVVTVVCDCRTSGGS